MNGDKDVAWLRFRAAEERRRAESAAGVEARQAHRQLADLYEREAADAEGPVAGLMKWRAG